MRPPYLLGEDLTGACVRAFWPPVAPLRRGGVIWGACPQRLPPFAAHAENPAVGGISVRCCSLATLAAKNVNRLLCKTNNAVKLVQCTRTTIGVQLLYEAGITHRLYIMSVRGYTTDTYVHLA